MIKFEGEHKVSANEFSKLFIAKSIQTVIANMESVFDACPEIYSEFTEKEKAAIIEQMGKRAEGLSGYLSIDKLHKKIGYEK